MRYLSNVRLVPICLVKSRCSILYSTSQNDNIQYMYISSEIQCGTSLKQQQKFLTSTAITICFLLTRFRDGLKSLGVFDTLQRYPLKMKCLFVKPEKRLTATDVENLFQIIYSERGSNAFQQECRTLAFWQDYLQDAECKCGLVFQQRELFSSF